MEYWHKKNKAVSMKENAGIAKVYVESGKAVDAAERARLAASCADILIDDLVETIEILVGKGAMKFPLELQTRKGTVILSLDYQEEEQK